MGTSDLAATLAMMQLTDSAIPTGAFSHSLGLEVYLAREEVTGTEDFAGWLEMFVAEQLTFTDAVAVRLVHRAERFDEVADIDRLVTAQALPRQIREGQQTMGRRLLSIAAATHPGRWVDEYLDEVTAGRLSAHPATVLAVVGRNLGLDEDTVVAQHLYATVVSLTQNAVRGIPLGQNAGQDVQRRAQDWVQLAVERSRPLGRDDLGAISPGLEIAQMQHERQRARMFMS